VAAIETYSQGLNVTRVASGITTAVGMLSLNLQTGENGTAIDVDQRETSSGRETEARSRPN